MHAEIVKLVRNIPNGHRRAMRVSTVTSPKGLSVRIQSLADDLDGHGMRSISKLVVLPHELDQLINALSETQAQIARARPTRVA